MRASIDFAHEYEPFVSRQETAALLALLSEHHADKCTFDGWNKRPEPVAEPELEAEPIPEQHPPIALVADGVKLIAGPGHDWTGPAETIIRDVAARHGIEPGAIKSASVRRDFVRARHEAMFEMRMRGMSLKKIGRMLAKDHCTVINGIRRHEQRMADEQLVRAMAGEAL